MLRTALMVSGAAVLLASCTALSEFIDHPGDFRKAEGRVVIPSTFLHSGSDALDDWLNEPYKLRFDEMNLRDVFATHPLNSMRYRFEGLPADAPRFNMDSAAMTRRQLLYALAEGYDLVMSIEYVDRMPYAIVVRYDASKPTKDFLQID